MSDNEILTEGYALSTLHQRVITGLLLVLVAGGVVFIGGWLLLLALMAIAVLMDKEWQALRPDNSLLWQAFGIAYIALPIISALALRDLSLMALLFPVALIIATDTGAYFAGRSIGGAKLAPRISPNKTWAGLIGGMVAASAVALMLYPLMPLPNTALSAILVGCFTALLGQAGDLFESWLKRRKGLKDSGSLLPGHGGILDRLDSYATVLPFFLLYLVISAEVMA